MGIFSKLLSVGEDKPLKKYQKVVETINDLEPRMQAYSDDELAHLTVEFRERLDSGEELDDLLPEAFAAVREASVRTIGLRHFDVQLIGGMALHDGKIAEMKTGEGKTLVSTLAGYLNALPGKNVHIVTVNDYLAARDSEWMGQVYRFLGMSVGLIQNGMDPLKKIPAYQADVTYGTNSEFGFDYLRDNMVTRASRRVQRGHAFAVVDEVDSILIDEARTPLIISGAGSQAADTYKKFAAIMPSLKRDIDFEMDEAKKTIYTTEAGLEKVEFQLGVDDIFGDPTGQLPNHLHQALRAQFLFHRDVDYVVTNGEVKIVDEFTGRIMEGRRYSEGLHQALEAKEHVLVRQENQTLATITLQNYFRLYEKLSGMTGTAMTEDAEFRQIYKLPVMAIPPNKPVIREDLNDLIFRTIDAKFNAVADDISERHNAGQPCLVGTVSIESSERLSRLLSKRGIKHEVLNAKNHEREAAIIAQAGRTGAVTIATNMAGRGTDILLGGNADVMAQTFLTEQLGEEVDQATPEQIQAAKEKAQAITKRESVEVRNAGGLCVIGTERHESRRIDNQLRGRSGRQGDPGTTQFYLSLEDDLMRLFGGSRMDSISRMMEKTDMPEDMPIQASMVSKAIETAQRQVESVNFSTRKHVLEYDDVMNLQRKAIYEERNAILDGKDLTERMPEIIEDVVENAVLEYCAPKQASDDWDTESLDKWLLQMTDDPEITVSSVDHDDDVNELMDGLIELITQRYNQRVEEIGPLSSDIASQIMLRFLDTSWMAHLQEMDYLKASIGLRAYGQRDPLTEYREEAHRAFAALTDSIYEGFLRFLLRAPLMVQEVSVEEEKTPLDGKVTYSNPEEALTESTTSSQRIRQAQAQAQGVPQTPQPTPEQPKPHTIQKDKDDPYANVGRNDPCPCGSGKKFKKCHGANR
ncbi:MAG: preprotein translocase subunit SecA [Eggerthellaceae bacterium]|nr:preprotein translocase subunit SecA [Eggerthellaceae bacterium]